MLSNCLGQIPAALSFALNDFKMPSLLVFPVDRFGGYICSCEPDFPVFSMDAASLVQYGVL